MHWKRSLFVISRFLHLFNFTVWNALGYGVSFYFQNNSIQLDIDLGGQKGMSLWQKLYEINRIRNDTGHYPTPII